MKKIKLIIFVCLSTLTIFAQKINGNLDVDGSAVISGNITVTGTLTASNQTATSYLVEPVNLFNTSLILTESIVNPSTGINGSSGGWFSTGKQKVKPNTRYYATIVEFPDGIAQPTAAARSYYDIDGNFVAWDTLEADNSWITPANVYFAQWSTTATITEFSQIIEVASLVDPIVLPDAKALEPGFLFDGGYVNSFDAYLRQMYLPLLGKQWVLLGDSITQQAKYVKPVQQATGLIVNTNIGVGGALVGGIANNLTQQMVDEADVISVYVGTNDYGLNPTAIGTIADASNAGTFYGDVRNSLEAIHGLIATSSVSDAEKMKKLVIYVTPVQRGTAQDYTPPEPGSGGKTLVEVVQAIKDVCAEFGTPVFDGFALSGINQINIGYASDQLHPNDLASIYGIPLGKFMNLMYRGF